MAEAGRAAFGLDPDAPGFATNRERVGNRDAVIELLDAAFADIPHAELLARLAEIGIPAGEVRTLDRVYDWDQTAVAGPGHRRRPPAARHASRSPGRRSGSTTTRLPAARSEHLHPPLLGEHDDSVRAWLDELDGSAIDAPGRDGRGRDASGRPRPARASCSPRCSTPARSTSWDTAPLAVAEPRQRLRRRARGRGRCGPAPTSRCITGEGRIRGRPVAVVVSEFALPRRLDRAGRGRADHRWPFERATAEGLPLLAAPASGGTRMQEGTPAFVDDGRRSRAALAAHKAAGCPTSSTCATRRPAASSPRGARSGT